MRQGLLYPLVVLALLTAPVSASMAAEKKGDAAHPWVDLAPVALPVVVEGQLRNYVFVSVRLTLAPQVVSKDVMEKEPIFRDALVRASHRTPFTIAGQLSRLDEAAIARFLMAEANRITGPGVVMRVDIRRATPQRRLVGS